MSKPQRRVDVVIMFVAAVLFGCVTYTFSIHMFAMEDSLTLPEEGSITVDAAELRGQVAAIVHTVKFCLMLSLVGVVGTVVAVLGFLYCLLMASPVADEKPKVWPKPLPE